MTTLDPTAEMLADMGKSAYRLGMAFSDATEKALGTDRWLPYFNAFDRCFFSLRVATALRLRLLHAPAEAREAVTDREALIERPDPPETERPETERPEVERPERYDERDRDRETERASFPLLLRTLEGVVGDAEKLPGPEPAELPSLRELLAHAKAKSPPAAPRTAQTLRARLSGSGAAAAPPAKPHLASNVGQVLAARRATGPPRR